MGLSDSSNKMSNCNTSFLQEPDSEKFPDTHKGMGSGIADEIQKDDIVSCAGNGVQFFNLPDMFKVVYTGELAQNGAENVYVAIGYGNNGQWENIEQHQMNKTAFQTFELLTFRKKPGNINIAFKDSADNWDNNSGHNYVFYGTADGGSH